MAPQKKIDLTSKKIGDVIMHNIAGYDVKGYATKGRVQYFMVVMNLYIL